MTDKTPFNYTFTPKELTYYLFKKKKCPLCGGIMTKSKKCTIKQGCELQPQHGLKNYMDNEDVRDYKIFYTCTSCNRTFSLSELAGEKGEA